MCLLYKSIRVVAERAFKLRDYITTAVDIPFPDDKTALEVSVTLQARTLQECTYRGKWIIQG